MKRSEKRMNPRTKRLLIISLVCLILGAMFLVIGFLKGPSVWAAWDGKQLITSNYMETFNEKRETDPFTSVIIEVPAVLCTIEEGDTYSIEMTSCLPGVKPVIKEEGGVLSIKMEDYRYLEHMWILTPLEDTFSEENKIIITVPAGTKLDEIRFVQDKNWSNDSFGLYRNVKLNGISAAVLNCDDGFYHSYFTLGNCNIDQVNLKDTNHITLDKLTSDTIQLNYSESSSVWYANDLLYAKSINANTFTVNFEDANKSRLVQIGNIDELKELNSLSYNNRSINMEDCVIQNLDLISCEITLSRVETQKATVLAKESLLVKNCTLKGDTILRSAGTLSMGLEQPLSDFNGTAMAGIGFMNGPVTELVDFGTPEYNHGFVTEESKSFGTQVVEISDYEYGYLNSYEKEMMKSEKQNNKSSIEQTTAVYYETKIDDAYAKYYDYVALNREYDQEAYEGRCMVEVYNKKAVTYFVNETGERNYVEPYNNPTVLKINSETHSQLRYHFGAGPNKMDLYSAGSSDLKFGN